jgi:uncharacterized protein
MDLFPRDKRDGVFRGFQQGGLEFNADLVLPYRNELQNVPMHGQFLLVQLELRLARLRIPEILENNGL